MVQWPEQEFNLSNNNGINNFYNTSRAMIITEISAVVTITPIITSTSNRRAA
jgi:hypothetical protein